MNWIDQVSQAYQASRDVALMFDYDGSLTPIVAHPDLAVLSESTRQVLRGLSRLDGITVGVISGRALPDLKSKILLDEVWYAGSGGMHLELDGVERIDSATAEFEQKAAAIIAEVEEVVRWFPGTWIQRKEGCLSLHYRVLPPLRAACFSNLIGDTLARRPLGRQLRIRDVTQSIEIALARSWTKGDAVKTFHQNLPNDCFPVYAGDAANDQEAIEIVNALGGATIGIGPEAPEDASYRLKSSEEFVSQLQSLFETLQSCSRTNPNQDNGRKESKRCAP